MNFIFFVVLFLIAYGSFYPFDVSLSALSADEVEWLFTSWKFYSGRGDVLGNFGLFLPYGFFGLLAVPRNRSFVATCLSLSIFGVIFAALLQVAQLVIVSRDAEMGDVIWNLLGIVAGALAARPRRIRDLFDARGGGVGAAQAIPLVLFGCWVIASFAPFVPSIDLQSFKDSLKPLLSEGTFQTAEFVRETVSWLIVALIGTEIARLLPPGPWRSDRVWLPALMAATLLAKVVVIQNEVTLSDATAVVVALPAWFSVKRLGDRVPRFLLSLACIMVFVAALEPFDFRADAGTFHWVPFAGSLTGSMVVNAKVLAAKFFAIGAIFYLCRRCGYAPGAVTATVFIYLGALEFGQVWIGNHTPEITDPFLALLMGAGFAALGNRLSMPPNDEVASPQTAGKAAVARPDDAAAKAAGRMFDGPAAATPLITPNGLIALALSCIVVAAVMHVVLSLPKVPYNVRELFGGNDSWWRLLMFALSVATIGMGGAFAGRCAASRRFPLLRLPAAAVGACIVTYLLLAASVTSESLADIVGSSNTYYYVTEKNLWGPIAKNLFAIVGTGPVSAVERIIRFIALFGPVFLWIAIPVGVYRTTGREGSGGALAIALCGGTYLICALPWLFLFRFIAFTRSSTDNLNELIQNNGAMLYPLLVLLPIAALAVAHAARQPGRRPFTVAVTIFALSLPLGWYFLTNGLAEEVRKYDKVFSGVDFLLGPDRTELLSRTTLAFRWIALQSAATLALAFGIRLLLPSRIRRPRTR